MTFLRRNRYTQRTIIAAYVCLLHGSFNKCGLVRSLSKVQCKIEKIQKDFPIEKSGKTKKDSSQIFIIISKHNIGTQLTVRKCRFVVIRIMQLFSFKTQYPERSQLPLYSIEIFNALPQKSIIVAHFATVKFELNSNSYRPLCTVVWFRSFS